MSSGYRITFFVDYIVNEDPIDMKVLVNRFVTELESRGINLFTIVKREITDIEFEPIVEAISLNAINTEK